MKTATAPLPPLRSVKVLDQLRERIRYLHYSLRTEQAYVNWVRAFIRFHGVDIPMARRAWLEHGHSCFLCE
uniref:phage integrase N-terminal SAM-like domain-containing protein n=1 Tax=Salmonella sp. s36468 TaxID=3159641 RepID=UPI00397F8433